MNNILEIVPFNTQKSFSEDEAYELINFLMAVTHKAKNNISNLNGQLDYHKHIPHEADAIQERLNLEIEKWSDKVKRLGTTPLALFSVKIPGEKEDFIWDFPKSTLERHS